MTGGFTSITTLNRQLEELQLLQYSLLPGELLTFIHDAEQWSHLLKTYPTSSPPAPKSNACLEIRLESTNIQIQVVLSYEYPNDLRSRLPTISVKGDMGRDEQAKWQRIVSEKIQEVEGNE
jgi:hypothetical protein